MIYLDTHIVVWLYAGLTAKLSDCAKHLINENELYISPIVRLELQYLYEIGRITEKSDDIVLELVSCLDLKVCKKAEMLNPYIKLYIQADENRRSLREIKFPSCDKIKLT